MPLDHCMSFTMEEGKKQGARCRYVECAWTERHVIRPRLAAATG